jgi:protein phosphatase 1 regulatory subunit 7
MEKENTPLATDGADTANQSPKDSKGWDGKLRVERRQALTDPEAVSDPEYSDEDVLPGEQISADEGIAPNFTRE